MIDKTQQKKIAAAKFKATHKMYSFYLDEVEDAAIITWLERQGNRSEALRRIIRKAVIK